VDFVTILKKKLCPFPQNVQDLLELANVDRLDNEFVQLVSLELVSVRFRRFQKYHTYNEMPTANARLTTERSH